MAQIYSHVKKIVFPLLNNEDKCDFAQIVLNWEKIVGEDLMSYSVPRKVRSCGGKKVLSIMVYNSAIGAEMHYMKKHFIERIAFFAGKQVVDDIKLHFCNNGNEKTHLLEQSFLQKKINPKKDKRLSGIRDDDLQDSLSRLLHCIEIFNKR